MDRLAAIAEPVMLAAGEVLIREGDRAPHIFNISSGSIRVYKLLPDGRRQIIGFLFAGDFLGLAVGDAYVFSAEAMEPGLDWEMWRGPGPLVNYNPMLSPRGRIIGDFTMARLGPSPSRRPTSRASSASRPTRRITGFLRLLRSQSHVTRVLLT